MISVIVPVYNVGPYLARCIDSIISQEYKDLEIMLIDDGSTDSSPEICDQYKLKDSRISVYHKKNGGVSSARNLGLKKATGKYVSFVDADDWLLPACLKNLLTAAEEHDADICAGGRVVVSDTEETPVFNKTTGVLNEQDKIDWIQQKMGYSYEDMKTWLRNDDFSRGTVVWGRLYRKSLIDDNSMMFDRKIKVAEDLVFDVRAAMLANVIVLTDKAEYCYYQREDSAIHRYLGGDFRYLVDNKIQLAYKREEINKEFLAKGHPDISYMYQGSFVLSCAEIAMSLGRIKDMKFRDKIRHYRRYSESKPVKKARKNLTLDNLSLKNKVALWLIKHNWYVALLLAMQIIQRSK